MENKSYKIIHLSIQIIACVIIAFFSCFSCWFSLEIGDGYSSKTAILRMKPAYITLNLLTLLIIYLMLWIITNKLHRAHLCFSIVIGLLAVINYYTVLLHGSPLSIHELSNLKTALNVLGMYKLSIDRYVLFIVTLIAINCFNSYILKRLTQTISIKLPAIIIRDIIFLFVSIVIIYNGYLSNQSVKPHKTISWSWVEAYQTYGYPACTVETIQQIFNAVNKPNGYSEKALEDYAVPVKEEATSTPDILLILNESFYDLSYAFDINTDIDYFENIHSTDNLFEGHAIVPLIGGGTNVSEYELLTSNSANLFPGATPFNIFSMKNANSIVSHLNKLGYKTIGAHNAVATNYNRNTAYPNIGFDNIYFRDDFKDIQYYAKRDIMTDSSAFTNVIDWYRNQSDDSPLFTYLLTIQNHGGWDTNSPEDAIVHTLDDLGKNKDIANEYLSCIHLTDMAFKQLTDYFSTVDKPTIICMVGDHSPWFVTELNSQYSDSDKNLLYRSVPYIVWANYDVDYSSLSNEISLNYVVPSLLELGNIHQSPYYSYMNSLRKEIPVISDFGIYIDSEGRQYPYSSDTQHTNSINMYFNMEYNNLHKSRIQRLFD